MKIVAFVPDLMDRSRFPKAADVTFVRTAGELTAASVDAELVVADLNRDGAYEALSSVSEDIRRIGFTNHENNEAIQATRAEGIEAMARSRFFSRIAQITLGDSSVTDE